MSDLTDSDMDRIIAQELPRGMAQPLDPHVFMGRPTLTDFLLARIAEDEARASGWPSDGDGPWGHHPAGGFWMDPDGHTIYAPRERVLADCEAKRLIVQRATDRGQWDRNGVRRAWDNAYLLDLATAYRDHPDFGEWKP